MDLVRIYECFCDRTRLRILHLLTQTPLCVCHFQEILGEPQVKVSKHLAYLRSRGLVETKQEKNWVIYSLPKRPPEELEWNLKCLQACVQSNGVFKRDASRLQRLRASCCEPREVFTTGVRPEISRLRAKGRRNMKLTRKTSTPNA